MFMSSSRNKFTLLYPNSVTDVFVGFRPPRLVPIQVGTSIASPYKSLYINLGKTFLRISPIRNVRLIWILARNLVYLPPFNSKIPDFIYWTLLILILIYFEWRDAENQQLQHSSWKERWSEKWNESSNKCFRHETSRLSTPIPFLPRQYGRGISKRIKRTTVKFIYWCSKCSFNESVDFLAMAISDSSSLRHISSIFAKLLFPVVSTVWSMCKI